MARLRNRRRLACIGGFVVVTAFAAACNVFDGVTLGGPGIGIGGIPAISTPQIFSWPAINGAVAYRVFVSTDRRRRWLVGTSTLVTGTSLDPGKLAWVPGTPVLGSVYFYMVEAYDRNSPDALLLETSPAEEIVFASLPSASATAASPATSAASPTTTPASPTPSPTARPLASPSP